MSTAAVVVAGPTGVGKTRVAARLAERCNGEVVSADSVQAYHGLDVGSGKATEEERRGVKHHLLGELDPLRESWSAYSFMAKAAECVKSIAEDGMTPIVAGGSGFYLKWLLRGSPGTPPPSEKVAHQAEQRIQQAIRADERNPWEAAIGALKQAGDEGAWHRLHRNDWYRLRRSLEIALECGKPADSFDYGSDKSVNPPEDVSFSCFVLYKPREELYRSIDARCEAMLKGGLLSEALWLLRGGIRPGKCPASRAIGYRQAMQFLEWAQEQGGCTGSDVDAFLDRFQRESRNYAKRQLNWFRSQHATEFGWVRAREDTDDVVDELLDRCNGHRERDEGNIPDRLTKDEWKSLKQYESRRSILADHEINSIAAWVTESAGCF